MHTLEKVGNTGGEKLEKNVKITMDKRAKKKKQKQKKKKQKTKKENEHGASTNMAHESEEESGGNVKREKSASA